MYKILFILILLFTQLFSDTISWYANYDKALQKAHEEKKNMLLFIASSQNNHSNEVLKNYFMNKPYIAYLNENFINVLVTVEYKTSYPIELFYTTTFPTIFFVSYKDESVMTHPIYTIDSAEEFFQLAQSLKEK